LFVKEGDICQVPKVPPILNGFRSEEGAFSVAMQQASCFAPFSLRKRCAAVLAFPVCAQKEGLEKFEKIQSFSKNQPCFCRAGL